MFLYGCAITEAADRRGTDQLHDWVVREKGLAGGVSGRKNIVIITDDCQPSDAAWYGAVPGNVFTLSTLFVLTISGVSVY